MLKHHEGMHAQTTGANDESQSARTMERKQILHEPAGVPFHVTFVRQFCRHALALRPWKSLLTRKDDGGCRCPYPRHCRLRVVTPRPFLSRSARQTNLGVGKPSYSLVLLNVQPVIMLVRTSSNLLYRAVASSSRFPLSQRLFHASAIDLAKLNVEGLAEKVDLKGKNVLVRVDLNVPLAKVGRRQHFQAIEDMTEIPPSHSHLLDCLRTKSP